MGGGTVVSDDYIRLTPAEKSRTGSIWTQRPTHFQFWEVTLSVMIGGGGSMGADGMAFWYTLQPRKEGSAFGSIPSFVGLGILIDTFDNDGSGDHPRILVVTNDGSWEYNSNTDGKDRELGSCRIQLRNLETKLRISYFNSQIQVTYNIPSFSNNWQLCTSVNAKLPENGYFGVTAATGGLADNHDILGLETFELIPRVSSNPDSDSEVNQDEEPPYRRREPEYHPHENPQQNQNQAPVSKNNEVGHQNLPQHQQNEQNMQYQQNQNQPIQNLPPYQQTPPPEHNQFQQHGNIPPYQDRPNEPQTNTEKTAEQCDSTFSQQTLLQGISEEIKVIKGSQQDISTLVRKLEASVQSGPFASTEILEWKRKLQSDLLDLSQQVNQLQQEMKQIVSIRDSIHEVRDSISSRVIPTTDSGNRQLSSITSSLNNVMSKIESMKTEHHSGLQGLKQDFKEVSENQTNWGFWIFLCLFQMLFAVCFFGWKKYQDKKNKLF